MDVYGRALSPLWQPRPPWGRQAQRAGSICSFFQFLSPPPSLYYDKERGGGDVAVIRCLTINIGYDAGKSSGRALGYQEGYIDGREAPQYSFSEFFAGFGTAFINIWNGILNFDFLGVNIAGLIGCVLVVVLVLIVLKMIGKA